MKTRLIGLVLVAVTLASACATVQIDPRTKELITLKAERVALDAAFATAYTAESRKILAEVKARGGTIQDYFAAIESWVEQRIRVSAMCAAIDAAAHGAAQFIESGYVGDVSAPVRSLIKELRLSMLMFGIRVAVPR